MKPLSLGYSPCPNDTFIFYALVHGLIDTHGLQFNETLLDVETLNKKALNAALDITKVSYAAFGRLRDNYTLLRSGGALGRGCGPLVVAKEEYSMSNLKGKKIAVPGMMTTAFLLLQLYYSSVSSQPSAVSAQHSDLKVLPFNEIMSSVARGDTDAGLIIHESRFTYPLYGLKKILDLGEWWESETGLPIPLGGIIARRSLGAKLIRQIDNMLKQSVQYAFQHRPETMSYIKKHSQELSDEVINQHIDLYVNDFSEDVGNEGEEAIRQLLSRDEGLGIIPQSKATLFT